MHVISLKDHKATEMLKNVDGKIKKEELRKEIKEELIEEIRQEMVNEGK